MKLVNIKLLSGAEILINSDNICDIRKDPMNESYTLIQLNQGAHKVGMSIPEVLKLLGIKESK